jgi:hypothetical protein
MGSLFTKKRSQLQSLEPGGEYYVPISRVFIKGRAKRAKRPPHKTRMMLQRCETAAMQVPRATQDEKDG